MLYMEKNVADKVPKNKTLSTPLEKYRKEIDAVDTQLLSLLLKRQKIAKGIGEIKRDLGREVFDPARESNILNNLMSKADGLLTRDMIRHIFNEIISASRTVQAPMSVSFLGPETTFSHQAAICMFGHSVSLRVAPTIDDVFDLIEKGICKKGVVPIENSYEGSVNRTLDLFYRYDLKISAEIFLRIRHYLLSKQNSIKKIKRLYSHPMAIAQCRQWIKNHMPDVEIKEVQSTAHAAGMAVKDHEAGALGSRLSAMTYDLNTLEKNIEDSPDNVTRFLAIGKTEVSATGNDKTSFMFLLKHRPGALHDALGALARRGINMSRIESRPTKIQSWEYLFFVDIDGHISDKKINDALREMEESCVVLKRLGSYPASGEPWE